MKKLILIAFFLALSVVTPRAVLAADADRTVALAGTTWSGTDSDGDYYEYTFQQNGTLSYKGPNGHYTDGSWKQFGKAVYFETKDHFSERLGEIRGDSIEGKAWNVQGRFWTWKVSKEK